MFLKRQTVPAVQEEADLADLAGLESCLLFEIWTVSIEWLLKPMLSWPALKDFQMADAYVKSLKVVNDIAESGVKVMSNYAYKITTDNNHHQDLL